MQQSSALVWLRNDLRCADNPALIAACAHGGKVTALYIHETDSRVRAPGGATRWWLHHALNALAADLAGLGIPLLVRVGKAQETIDAVLAETGAQAVHWNRRYAEGERNVDSAIKADLRGRGIAAASHMGNLLIEPWDIATGQGKPYSVFTPFWKTLRDKPIPRPLPAPEARAQIKAQKVDSEYKIPFWAPKMGQYWTIGEAGAIAALDSFFEEHIADYKQGRDFPDRDTTSRLSPHLRFGAISPRQIWHATRFRADHDHSQAENFDKFLAELAWRDFSYHQLYHRDDISSVPMQAKYTGMRWRHAPKELSAWQRGLTGYPIVDAGMRELWEIGYMHNRVRMLVASLLTKNLLIDWRLGETWFWDCLVDGDVANNPASWQWVAGSGLDASPYFRIFNPVTQGERFDAGGNYVRRWVPELSKLPDEWIQNPAAAPADVLRRAGVELGKNYPHPIVDLKQTRQRALDAAAAL